MPTFFIVDKTGTSRLRFALEIALVAGLLTIASSGCTKPHVADPAASPSPLSNPGPSPRTAAVEPGPAIANLSEFRPRVTFRRKNELVWQESEKGLPLYQSDAVKTHLNAEAKLVFVNHSTLELAENTLVIVTLPKSKPSLPAGDRAIVRHGKLSGTTRNELWLLTSNALFHMKAESQGKNAIAHLSVQDGKQLQIELKAGSGAVLHRKSSGKDEEIVLVPNQPVVIEATAQAQESAADQDMDEWIRRFHATAPKPVLGAAPPAPPARADVFIESPANQQEVKGPAVIFRGKTTFKHVVLLVNGQEAVIGTDLSFAVSVPLQLGSNSISIQLIQPDGTSTFRRWLLFRKE